MPYPSLEVCPEIRGVVSGIFVYSNFFKRSSSLDQRTRSVLFFEPFVNSPLPATVTFGIDRDGSVRRRILEAMQLPGNVSLPVFLIGDTFNRVVFESHGYTIGLGDRLLHTIHQL